MDIYKKMKYHFTYDRMVNFLASIFQMLASKTVAFLAEYFYRMLKLQVVRSVYPTRKSN